jgi:tRNA(adenine34) deaminase
MMINPFVTQMMKEALSLAKEAYDSGEIPVGAIIVKNGEIVGRGRNMREEKQSALSHAETEVIAEACRNLNSWRLDGCHMFVTLEPCPMCAGAIAAARLDRVYFGAFDKALGAAGSAVNLFDMKGTKRIDAFGGILEEECTEILRLFFEKTRNN